MQLRILYTVQGGFRGKGGSISAERWVNLDIRRECFTSLSILLVYAIIYLITDDLLESSFSFFSSYIIVCLGLKEVLFMLFVSADLHGIVIMI